MLGASLLILAALAPRPFAPEGAKGSLRFESGRHTAAVRGVARDPVSGDWITVGVDKTVRRWRDGRPVGAPLRFATGDSIDGEFTCCAVSRSGLLAVGDGDRNKPCVWLYDLKKGAAGTVAAIHPKGRDFQAITALAFSADGGLLAAGDFMGGLHVWRVADRAPVAEPPAATPDILVYALAFAPLGTRLAVARASGNPEASAHPEARVEVLDAGKALSPVASLKPDVRIGALAWTGPSTLALGGDGGALERWTVGETSAKRVETGLDRNPDLVIHALAANADGKTLAAGTNAGDLLLLDGVGGPPRRTSLANDSDVWAVGLSPDGRTALAGLGNGEVREVEVSTARTSRLLSPALPRVTALRWSPDGGALAWKAGDGTTGFDLRRSAPGTSEASATEDGHHRGDVRLEVKDYRLVVSPDSRWKRLALQGYAVYDAILLDDAHLLAATDAGLKLFADDGRDGTLVPLPGDPTSLALSPDGKRIAVGFADGLVRIFDASMKGGPLVSIYLNGGEWVAWREDTGQYDSSAGGDSVFGFQVNRGDDQLATFVPAAAKEAEYRRPGLLQERLGFATGLLAPLPVGAGSTDHNLDLATAVTKVAAFQVLGVEEGEDTGEGYSVKGDSAVVRVKIENPDDERVSLRVGHDGTPRDLVNLTSPNPNFKRLRITGLAPGRNLVQVYVAGRPLPGAHFRIDSAQPNVKVSSRLVVLAVGVGRYAQATIAPLSAADDAKQFVRTVHDNAVGDLLETHFYDAEATGDAIRKGLAWLKTVAKPNDRVMVFLASHGDTVGDGTTYVAPYDYTTVNPAAHGLAWSDVARGLAAVPCRSMVLFCDNCYSGAAVKAVQSAPREATETMRGLASDMAVFAACTGEQTSREYAELGHGLFTYALLKGMMGDGGGINPTTGEVTTDNLQVAVRQTMEKWQHDAKVGSPQMPVILVPTQAAIPITHPKAPSGGHA